MYLADRRGGHRYRVPTTEEHLRRAAEFGRDCLTSKLRAHRRGVCAQAGQRHSQRLGNPLRAEAQQLAKLHRSSPHVPQRGRHVPGAAQLMGAVKLLAFYGRSHRPAHPVSHARAPSADAQPGQIGETAEAHRKRNSHRTRR
jgi:hypothetical protein